MCNMYCGLSNKIKNERIIQFIIKMIHKINKINVIKLSYKKYFSNGILNFFLLVMYTYVNGRFDSKRTEAIKQKSKLSRKLKMESSKLI